MKSFNVQKCKRPTFRKLYTVQEVKEKIDRGYVIGQCISRESVFDVWFSLVMSRPLTCTRQQKRRALDVLKRLEIPCW